MSGRIDIQLFEERPDLLHTTGKTENAVLSSPDPHIKHLVELPVPGKSFVGGNPRLWFGVALEIIFIIAVLSYCGIRVFVEHAKEAAWNQY